MTRLTAYISHVQERTKTKAPSLSLYHVLADWDWRIARLLSAFSFLGAAWTQFHWAENANVNAIAFYYRFASVACVVCAIVYWYLCAYDAETWNAASHKTRFSVQFVACLVWSWTMLLDGYSQSINAITTDWQHHWEINAIVISFLAGACLNQLIATGRALAYNDLGEEDE
jgi:hypothetical protein